MHSLSSLCPAPHAATWSSRAAGPLHPLRFILLPPECSFLVPSKYFPPVAKPAHVPSSRSSHVDGINVQQLCLKLPLGLLVRCQPSTCKHLYCGSTVLSSLHDSQLQHAGPPQSHVATRLAQHQLFHACQPVYLELPSLAASINHFNDYQRTNCYSCQAMLLTCDSRETLHHLAYKRP